MKLPFEEYNPLWSEQFTIVKDKLSVFLKDIDHQIDHIGSTSVEGLSAKPIIDIQIGVANQSDLDLVPELIKDPAIVYYQKYNQDMPTRRFFVLFSKTTQQMGVDALVTSSMEVPEILHNHDLRIAHIHAFIKGSQDWIRHLAFRDYLRSHAPVKEAYQELKQRLVQQKWKDGNQYNEAKDEFLKKYEKIALEWYKEND